jgi:hypothetical protein
MVQDLKRGGSIRYKDADGTARRRESILGIGTGEMDDNELGEPISRRRTQTDEERGTRRPSGRGRSLSGTLGDLWRTVRGVGSREDMRDEEARRDNANNGEGR